MKGYFYRLLNEGRNQLVTKSYRDYTFYTWQEFFIM